MTSDEGSRDVPVLDERAIARKYGIRELNWPDREHLLALNKFLETTIQTGRCGAVPKTAAVMALEFLQATMNRQHITKGPRMSPAEFDAIQAPYYVAARIVTRIQRGRQENSRGKVYQSTWVSLNHFVELLRNLLDPSCAWLRARAIPQEVAATMEAFLEFLSSYPDQRRKGRAL